MFIYLHSLPRYIGYNNSREKHIVKGGIYMNEHYHDVPTKPTQYGFAKPLKPHSYQWYIRGDENYTFHPRVDEFTNEYTIHFDQYVERYEMEQILQQ